MIDEKTFTRRELDIIHLLLQGKSNKQIGLELHLSQRTVEYHITNILAKLNVASRTEAVIRLSESPLRFSTGEPAEKLRESTVDKSIVPSDNEIAPVSHRRINMKKTLYMFSALILISAIFAVIKSVNLIPELVPTSTANMANVNPGQQTSTVSTPVKTISQESPPLSSTATTVPVPLPTTTWIPSVISPVYPGENVYLPPLPLQVGAWPATAGCPNPEGLEDFAGLLPEVVVDVLQHLEVGTKEAVMQWSDPAYWPVLVNPFQGQTITTDWINQIAPVDKSPYWQIIEAQCGEQIVKLSWYVQVCPGPCQTNGESQSLMTNMFLINRMQWLIWALQ